MPIEAMERAVDAYDHWKLASDPEEYREEPVDEVELEEPLVEEKWDGTIVVTMRPSGHEFIIRRTSAGALVGDYEVMGAGVYSDGHLSPDAALSWLLNDPEHWSW
jgi:hypothetical protein